MSKIGFAITEPEAQTIVAALRVAADQYDTDAHASVRHPRIRDQFLRQAKEARALADALEDRPIRQLTERELPQ